MTDLNEFNQWFHAEFEKYVTQSLDYSHRISTASSVYQRGLDQVIELSRAGKRIRPYLMDLSVRQFSNLPREEYQNALFGVELFHLFALIHDDVFDSAKQRRGIDCLHEVFSKNLPTHESNSLAVLIGDLVFSLANRSVNSLGIKRLTIQYYKMVDELVYGEFIDVWQAANDNVDQRSIQDKTDFKTARYTFVHPIFFGIYIAGITVADDKLIKALQKIGQAFQIQDDYLDIVSDALVIGKPVMQDLQEGQQTFFTDYLYTHPDRKYRSWIIENRRKTLKVNEYKAARKVFEESGAVAAGEKLYQSLYQEGFSELISQLQVLSRDNEVLSAWKELKNLLVNRVK